MKERMSPLNQSFCSVTRAPDAASASGPMSIRPPVTEGGDEEEVVVEEPGMSEAPAAQYERPYPVAPSRDPQPRNMSERPESAPQPLGRGQAPISTASSMAMISPTATLSCPLIAALDHWMANAVQPAALRWFGQPVVKIKQISAYSCRGMNGQRGVRDVLATLPTAVDLLLIAASLSPGHGTKT